jgi:hypothetical protein
MTLRVPNDALSFIALDDWGRNGEYNQHSVAGQMAVAARALDVQFILALGDNFYPSGVRSTADPQWRASFEDVYSAHALNVDWYVVLGNHDYKGNPQAEVDYSRVSRRWRMPARYDSVRRTIPGGAERREWMGRGSSRRARGSWRCRSCLTHCWCRRSTTRAGCGIGRRSSRDGVSVTLSASSRGATHGAWGRQAAWVHARLGRVARS